MDIQLPACHSGFLFVSGKGWNSEVGGDKGHEQAFGTVPVPQADAVKMLLVLDGVSFSAYQ